MSEKPLLTPLMQIQQNRTQSRVTAELTAHLQDKNVQALLRARYLHGTIRQYADNPNRSLTEFAHLRNAERMQKLGAFLIRTPNGDPIGLAQVQPNLKLRRHFQIPVIGALPMAPRLARFTPLVTAENTEGAAVHAWTLPEYSDELREAYTQLADPTGIAKSYHTGANSWVVEPKKSPEWVKAAIESAGYVPVKTGYYETDKEFKVAPPLSVLYQSIGTRPDLTIIT